MVEFNMVDYDQQTVYQTQSGQGEYDYFRLLDENNLFLLFRWK